MGITIIGWVGIVFGIITFFIGIVVGIINLRNKKNATAITSFVISILFGAVLIGGVLFYSSTEVGKRSYKDQQSNISGGITRTVTVYDMNGEIIKQYKGEFDVETTNDNYVLFDDENGKRHVIYITTGTIIIDEE